jgi:hypothetical protein
MAVPVNGGPGNHAVILAAGFGQTSAPTFCVAALCLKSRVCQKSPAFASKQGVPVSLLTQRGLHVLRDLGDVDRDVWRRWFHHSRKP